MARDPYEVLGIDPDAAPGEVHAAYRRLVALYHPDRLQGARPGVRAEGEKRLREATEALRRIEGGRSARRPLPDPDPFGPPVRIYDAELEAVAPQPRLHVRWGGSYARATLAALTRMHSANRDAVRQLEWGAYEVELSGSDMVRLLTALASGDQALDEPVAIVSLATSFEERLRSDGGPPPTLRSSGATTVALRRVLALLEPQGRYTLAADSL